MRTQRVAVVLTFVNVVVLLGLVSQFHVVRAQSDVAPVVRARSLEIVDDTGKVRAQILVNKGTDGSDTGVLLRLIDTDGKPLVKLNAANDGSALMLSGDHGMREWNGIQVLAKPGGSSLRILNKDGKERLVKPE
jgi:hypothetical protein